MWRDYVDSIVEVGQPSGGRLFEDGANIDTIQVDFPDFDSEMYHQSIPSNSYLISRVIKLMESNAEYKKRQMQMVDGKHLSGDHSFKLIKCVFSNGAKPFTVLYCILNEYCQVLNW